MTNLTTQIRTLKNSSPDENDEHTYGWNAAIDAVLEMLPDESPAELTFEQLAALSCRNEWETCPCIPCRARREILRLRGQPVNTFRDTP